MSKIGHASHDERGKYAGGQAGDQTKDEVCIRTWYSRPWNVVFWATEPSTREKMAVAMEQACANDYIGYDQGTAGNYNDRYTLYQALEKNGRQMAKISAPCETDCSNLVACCARCAGVNISPEIYTGNEKQAFKNAKDFNGKKVEFEFHTESKYLNSADYIPRGAVLLYEGHHTAINLENGKYFGNVVIKEIPVTTSNSGLKIVGAATLNVRDYPETGTVVRTAKSGMVVRPTAKALVNGVYWFKIGANEWISGKYVTGWVMEQSKWWFVKQGYTYDKNIISFIDGAYYAFDKDGWMITSDRINGDGSIRM